MKHARELVAPVEKKLRLPLIGSAVLIILIATLIMLSLGVYVQEEAESQLRGSLSETCQQNALNVQKEIDSRFRALRSMAFHIAGLMEQEEGESGDVTVEKIVEIINSLRSTAGVYDFYNVSMYNLQGQGYSTRGGYYDVSERSYFQKALNGEQVLTESLLSIDGRTYVNCFARPIRVNGESCAVLMAVCESARFNELMNDNFMGGMGHSMIISNEGKAVSYHPDVAGESSEIARYISENREILPQEGQESFVMFTYEGEEYIAFSTPLGMNDWHVLSYVPYAIIRQDVKGLKESIMFTLGLLYACIIAMGVICIVTYRGMANQILEIAFSDGLTSARNYEYLKVRYQHLSPEEREKRYLVAFDVDKFKFVNILYGSEAGDRLLQIIANTVRQTLPEAALFRSTGDTFAAVIAAGSREEVRDKVEELDKRIKQMARSTRRYAISLSYGVCRMDMGENLRMVYDNAIMAKSVAKGSTVAKYRFFDEIEKKQIAQKALELNFDKALEQGEICVWYQPKYDLRTREICGAEALARWRKSDGTMVFPGDFIPVLEANGRITELDEEVLRIVCRDIHEMESAGMEMKPISVNLSKTHLQLPNVVDRVNKIVSDSQIDRAKLSFEITESAVLSDRDLLGRLVGEMHVSGFVVDIDDYGVGSSSLRSLSSANFDTLKLDKSFVDNIGTEKTDIILKSTIQMAQELGMRLVAEGVENEKQARFLLENHCYVAQGFHFSKPLDRETYLSVLKEVFE